MKRCLLCLGAAVAGLALTAMPASAIINGTEDTTNQFSSTGLVVLGDGTHWCSGSLYQSQLPKKVTFMTAAHCTLGIDLTGAKVTFDPAGDTNPNATYIPVLAKYSIPSYATAIKTSNSLQNGNAVPDVAVLILKSAPPGVTPADLPSLGLVDTLNFNSQLITAVGYGATTATGKVYTYGARFYKTTGITPGQRAQSSDLYLKADASTCFADSGGPSFLYGTSTIIGVTSWLQSTECTDHNYIYRIDSFQALGFLHNPTTGVTN